MCVWAGGALQTSLSCSCYCRAVILDCITLYKRCCYCVHPLIIHIFIIHIYIVLLQPLRFSYPLDELMQTFITLNPQMSAELFSEFSCLNCLFNVHTVQPSLVLFLFAFAESVFIIGFAAFLISPCASVVWEPPSITCFPQLGVMNLAHKHFNGSCSGRAEH